MMDTLAGFYDDKMRPLPIRYTYLSTFHADTQPEERLVNTSSPFPAHRVNDLPHGDYISRKDNK